MRIGSFSSWTINYGDLFEERQMFYSKVSGVIPDVIFEYNQCDSIYDVNFVIPNGYKKVSNGTASIYVRY